MSASLARAANSWRKADAHLREAHAQDPDRSPMAIIHSSYYAMFHAARAVLIQATGTAPRTHDRTIQQFGLLVRDLDDSLRAAGRAFNAVKDERNNADYDETIVASAQVARDALLAAVDMLMICALRFGFPEVGPPKA